MTNFLLENPAAVLIHIPKTGGSSIQSLWGGRVAVRAFGHFPAAWEEFPSFAVVRHPVERFMSAFRMFKFGNDDLDDFYSEPRMPHLTITRALNILEDTSIEFDRSVRDLKSNLKHHLLPQTHQFNCLDRAKVILRTERLKEDYSAFAKSHGLEQNLPHIRRTGRDTLSATQPNSEELGRIYSVFSEDFKQLGYELRGDRRHPIRLATPKNNNYWSEWPAFFSDTPIFANDAAGALPAEDCELKVFADTKIKCPTKGTWPGREKNLITHFHQLQAEFGGKSRLSHLLSCCIVVIRRTKGQGPGLALFRRILIEHGLQICEEANMRWLTSICDTLVEFGETDIQRLVAFNGTLLANTVKLYETERRLFSPERPWPPKTTLKKGGEMFDGVITYWTERGDMIENMISRLEPLLQMDALAGEVVGELIARVMLQDTVFRRFAEIAGQPTKPLIKQHINERLEKIVSRHL